MSKGRGSIALIPVLLLLALLVPGIFFAITLGPGRAVSMAAASLEHTLIAGLPEQKMSHGLPQLALRSADDTRLLKAPTGSSTAAWATISKVDLPVQMELAGDREPAWRDARLLFSADGPFGPPTEFRLAPLMDEGLPRRHLALLAAEMAAVAVPGHHLLMVRIDGRPPAPALLTEQVGVSYERDRGLTQQDVQFILDTDQVQDMQHLLLAASRSDAAFDSLDAELDVAGFLRCHAVAELLGGDAAKPRIHLWRSPRDGRWHALLADARSMPPEDGAARAYKGDTLLRALLEDPQGVRRYNAIRQDVADALLADDAYFEVAAGRMRMLLPALLSLRGVSADREDLPPWSVRRWHSGQEALLARFREHCRRHAGTNTDPEDGT